MVSEAPSNSTTSSLISAKWLDSLQTWPAPNEGGEGMFKISVTETHSKLEATS